MLRGIGYLIISILVLMLPWIAITSTTHDRVYRDIESIPTYDVGVLLGTSPGINNSNLYFITRIEAAKELYERGKIKKIIVSGDNSTVAYNEPRYMRDALMNSGVPERDIIMDFAGLRTLDSVIRAREIFGLNQGFIIISQPYHVERALFLAASHDIDAIGYGAANVSLSYGLLPYIREIGARWVAVYDAWFGTEAEILGKKEPIIIEGSSTR